MKRLCTIGLCVLLLTTQAAAADDVYSGPQVGEKLPGFKAMGVFGDLADKEFDLIEKADGKPVALIFVHARTRPAFGLTNAIMKYASTRTRDGLTAGIIYLTDDTTATTAWVKNVKQHLAEGVLHGISNEGVEGPGPYGLNRNVTLTVLVGNEGKVTANYALVQPSMQQDGPKIAKAIVDVLGGGKVPSLAELGVQRRMARPNMRGADDPRLTSMLRSVINKEATADDVADAAAKVEKYVSENEAARKQLARISNTVVNSGRLENYGTEAAQEILRKWAKKFGDDAKETTDDAPQRPERKKKRGDRGK